MAHFAKLDENNIVISIHTVNNDVITVDGKESEELGIQFLKSLYNHSFWKQTSYNGTFRKQYAGLGFIYDPINDVFIAPKPYPSWQLDKNFNWQAPIPEPTDNLYKWDELNLKWIPL